MSEMENLGLRFVRRGAGLLVLGLVTGYGPLGHYLQSGVTHACPWAPMLNLWLSIDGVFLSLYGVGCLVFCQPFCVRHATPPRSHELRRRLDRWSKAGNRDHVGHGRH